MAFQSNPFNSSCKFSVADRSPIVLQSRFLFHQQNDSNWNLYIFPDIMTVSHSWDYVEHRQSLFGHRQMTDCYYIGISVDECKKVHHVSITLPC